MNPDVSTKQKFLSKVFDMNGNQSHQQGPWSSGNSQEYSQVQERVRLFCLNKKKNCCNDIIDEKVNWFFCKLAMALSKYDYYGGPCDWNPKHNKEKYIYDWCCWAIENEDKYLDAIKQILTDYDNNLIPDAFSLMIDFCC